MRRVGSVLSWLAFGLLLVGPGLAQAAEKENGKRKARDPEGVERLMARTGGQARVSVSEATGAARFVGFKAGFHGDLMAESGAGAREKARAFVHEYSRMLGLDSADVTLVGERVDKLSQRHLTFEQSYRGVPVFAGLVRAHFEGDGRLVTVNGNLVPGIRLNPTPSRSASEAAAMAIALVSGENEGREVYARSGILTVYRTGLAQGIDGESHLTWQIEVGNGSDIREFLYVDAHTGKLVDRLPGIFDALDRRAYNAMGLTAPGPNYPATPFWVEGDDLPTASVEADNMIYASGETYDTFFDTFGRDSFDGIGATMDSIFNRGNACPNASWNGTFISFCPGTTSDDVTAHEWGHAYTQYTHDLIYAWQPGALNESYSDIWGETVDLINGRQTDSPSGLRSAGSCTAFTTLPPILHVNTPASIAGDYPAGAAQFGPALTPAGLTGDVVLVNDGVGNPTPPTGAAGNLSVMDGCETPFVNAADLAGRIAMVYRGTCGFAVKVKNAQNAGAIGVIVSNHTLGGNGVITMAGVDPTITIPSLSVGNANGEIIRAQLPGVNATLRLGGGQPIDNSYRWLIGEDATAFGGAIRDMWNPTCYSHPGKVSDTQYFCATADNGGVHFNSGIPNHAFALIVDGGTYNGRTITGLGLTKAAHIYYRAQTVYQGPTSDFADHEDAIEQSAADLVGIPLTSLTGGPPETITAGDVTEVEEAMEAVEMSLPPTQCNFQPILAQNPPALCPAGTRVNDLVVDDFENGPGTWTVSHLAVVPADFTDRDWEISSDLPDGRDGSAFFGINPNIGTCAPGGDESGVIYLTSPQLIIPNSSTNARLTFVHWIATEGGWDGGNVKISVNGGPWQLVNAADFIHNPYNTTLEPAPGNTNPLAGQPAWSGTDGGSVDGSWGRSIITLTPYVQPKDKVRIRFELGNDGCTGFYGWYVDDFEYYRCK